jgi:hypothetical protein
MGDRMPQKAHEKPAEEASKMYLILTKGETLTMLSCVRIDRRETAEGTRVVQVTKFNGWEVIDVDENEWDRIEVITGGILHLLKKGVD